jgi:hypothetical protein
MYSEQGFKFLTKKMLLSALRDVPDNAMINCNAVGNLSVRDPETEETTGFIDFILEGHYEQHT